MYGLSESLQFFISCSILVLEALLLISKWSCPSSLPPPVNTSLECEIMTSTLDPCRTFIFSEGMLSVQNLHFRSYNSFGGFSCTLVVLFSNGFPFPSLTKRTSSWFIVFSCRTDVADDLQMSMHWPNVSFIVCRSFFPSRVVINASY